MKKIEKEGMIQMNKPYIVCYMMTSVDGRIDCDMVGRLAGVEDYYPLLDELGPGKNDNSVAEKSGINIH